MSNESRFADVSRRAFIRRSLVMGAVVSTAGLAACGTSDEEAFSSASTPAPTASPTAAADSTTGTSEATPVTDATGTTTAPLSGAGLPPNAALTVNFSFSVADGGRARNPYIAVWLENADGDLVETVALWYKLGRGERWLSHLKEWYNAEATHLDAGGTDILDTVSSATRVPGAYSVVWEGTDSSGGKVQQGTYFLCIEAAREHGPYELVREQITLGAESTNGTLADQGELNSVSFDYVV